MPPENNCSDMVTSPPLLLPCVAQFYPPVPLKLRKKAEQWRNIAMVAVIWAFPHCCRGPPPPPLYFKSRASRRITLEWWGKHCNGGCDCSRHWSFFMLLQRLPVSSGIFLEEVGYPQWHRKSLNVAARVVLIPPSSHHCSSSVLQWRPPRSSNFFFLVEAAGGPQGGTKLGSMSGMVIKWSPRVQLAPAFGYSVVQFKIMPNPMHFRSWQYWIGLERDRKQMPVQSWQIPAVFRHYTKN